MVHSFKPYHDDDVFIYRANIGKSESFVFFCECSHMKNVFPLLYLLLFYTATNAADAPLWLRYPAISPDGSTIVFAYRGDLYKVAAGGGDATPLTMDGQRNCMP